MLLMKNIAPGLKLNYMNILIWIKNNHLSLKN